MEYTGGSPMPVFASRRHGPLNAWTFWRRNPGKAAPLVAVILLAVMLICGIVALMDSIPLSIRTIYAYSRRFVAITPRGDPALPPKIVARVRAGSPVPVERIVLCRATGRQVMSIVGKWPFAVIGLTPDDARYYLRKLGVAKLEGRMPQPGEAAAVVSEPVARNLKLSLGDPLQKPDDQENYSPRPVTIVGIAHTDEWLMIGDYEYQKENHFPPVDGVLAFAADPASQEKLDRWAFDAFKGERASVLAYFDLNKDTDLMFRTLYRILNVVIGLLVLVITIMMGMLFNIYQSQRLVEFGLLQSLGHTRAKIVARVLAENAIVVVLGWVLGVAASFGLLAGVDRALMRPNAYALHALDPHAFVYTVPVPIAILAAATATVLARFRRFDPVGVVERRIA